MRATVAGVSVLAGAMLATGVAQAPAGALVPTRVPVPLVKIGNPGNAADATTGFGAVGSNFSLAKFDITIAQYTNFLNSVAKSDPNGLYNAAMGTDGNVSGIKRSGVAGRYVYSVKGVSGAVQVSAATGPSRPITYVSWFDSARFANWLANGQPIGAQGPKTTENGAYNLQSSAAGNGYAVVKNVVNPNTRRTPTYYLPNENQWFKASFYSPELNGGAGGYYMYGTESNAAPTNQLSTAAGNINYAAAARFAVTQALNMDLSQNYLTDVGAYTGTPGAYGTYDLNGSVWEWNDNAGEASLSRSGRGGGWTSFYTYLQSDYRLGNTLGSQSTNLGFRLASTLGAGTQEGYNLVEVDDAGNPDDSTGFGGVSTDYRIGTYEVTIQQYTDFLNAVAATDTNALWDSQMGAAASSMGIARAGASGSYTYTVINNMGDSANRPITSVSWYDAARFANWMANGRPSGAQTDATTEDGTYDMSLTTSGEAAPPNATNPNTSAAPTFSIPTEDQWYKAAYYKGGSTNAGYWKYATQSNTAPGNIIGSAANQVNYINDADLSYTYSVSQIGYVDPSQNYLTDVGYFVNSPNYYGNYDLAGNVYMWNDLDGTQSRARGLRGGFWFSGPVSATRLTNTQVSPLRESSDTGIRVAAVWPAPPHDVRNLKVSGTRTAPRRVVSWQPPAGGGAPTRYSVVIRQASNNRVVYSKRVSAPTTRVTVARNTLLANSTVRSARIPSLQTRGDIGRSIRYRVVVVPVNSTGAGGPVGTFFPVAR